MIYVSLADEPHLRDGWAVPIATDIAFGVGILALLGKSVPTSIRILLLSLAVIDDILAVIIIAALYSSGVDVLGMLLALAAVLMVLGMQRLGVRSALAYAAPVWTCRSRGRPVARMDSSEARIPPPICRPLNGTIASLMRGNN